MPSAKKKTLFPWNERDWEVVAIFNNEVIEELKKILAFDKIEVSGTEDIIVVTFEVPGDNGNDKHSE